MNRLIACLLLFASLCAGSARAAMDPALLAGLAADESDDKIAAIAKVAALADADALRVLVAMSKDNLMIAGDKFYIADGDKLSDAATGAELSARPDGLDSLTINNRVRSALDSALAGLRLFSPNRDKRYAAARELQDSADAALLPLIERALKSEQDAEIRTLLQYAQAVANLQNADAAVRLEAAKALSSSSNPSIKSTLLSRLQKQGDSYAEADEKVRAEIADSIKQIDKRLARADAIARVFTGVSLGSILLLAALGLAITYGVMGVINMAHGELLMVGAYSAYFMQGVFRAHWPDSTDWYLVAAVPLAFFAAAAVGVLMERTVIRFLYGRPLETLLATWGLSLVLIQAARVLFGAQNVEVANPGWMSGAIEVLPNVVLPWNRIVIIGFAGFVLSLVWLLMNRTRLGMFVRAVTQNRAMAGCVGVPTARIDTLAFAIGAGIAGLGGLALSQIANVGPDMGQGYIVDSFMVVVLGGVGQLAGAVWAALGLGVASKFLEGWTGAVIAKILVLVFIIVFIQKRPQGLFALKGRFVES
ncbi:MAG: urea ABC transporter permease subunit UrtB [Rhodocyclaceae bacterium]|nr:urea ABC transporter permease subunit UrtB [Rhodocyclaceae bacterium]MBX3669011.1 urea ABC transporter permease subunit UrtB [Rhodocyclaceae bacterium]